MDLAYLRSHPQQLPTFLKHQRIRETPVAGGSISAAARLTLDDGASLFVKTWPEQASAPTPEGFFTSEAAGIDWLRTPGGPPLPEVLVALPEMLALEWLDAGSPTKAAAERFGRELAIMHRVGAPAFGAGWPGYIGALPQDNTLSAQAWPQWFAASRLLPYLRLSADGGALSAEDVAATERLIDQIDGYGGAEPPSRIHGDLWPGNLYWAADGRAWLIDPAAHGGHRETDLAQLALWGGAPELARILDAYQEEWPLADGWQRRVPLHQLHLLLVHTALFGSAYRSAVRQAVDTLLRS
ncbi:fructosamine kinase family protein [Asanoa iriomotensis]|uniref:Fructosamine kinase n=1 Tax=Asanoa iriomotensis TaxID=234613 RepID=A0ABQ4C0J2_9ACTN|nr:fructosamine kinase family protein [Asanoa iriomotensis]GIF56298.1 fructosamine kinase [Asanoa iriomotensis]